VYWTDAVAGTIVTHPYRPESLAQPTITPPRKDYSKAGVVAGTVAVIGSFWYAIYAYADDRFPAVDLIRLQAARDGHFYVKFTVITAWFVVLAGLAGAGAAAWIGLRSLLALVSLATGKGWPRNEPLPAESSWKQLSQRSRLTPLVGGIIASLVGVVVGYLFVVDTDLLMKIGQFGAFVVFLGACALIGGPLFLLDGLFLPERHVGYVEDLKVIVANRGRPTTYVVISGGRAWRVPHRAYVQLAVGSSVALLSARASKAILDLRIGPQQDPRTVQPSNGWRVDGAPKHVHEADAWKMD
jgi:hypothetical protein